MSEKDKKIIVFVLSNSTISTICSGTATTNVDGTSAATLALASRIIHEYSDSYLVYYLDELTLNYIDPILNKKVNFSSDLIATSICICPAIFQQRLKSIAKYFDRFIVWIHHPFWRVFLPDQDIAAYVYCGSYVSKLRPVNLPKKKTYFIHNIQKELMPLKVDHVNDGFDVTFIGALISSKGILKFLADVYHISKSRFIKVGIIGSISLYVKDLQARDDEISNFDPVIQSEARILIDSIRANGSICTIFGAMGGDRFSIINASKILVVNPLGTTEALSTSVIEGYQLNVVTLSGFKNGNKELIGKYNAYSRSQLLWWLFDARVSDYALQKDWQLNKLSSLPSSAFIVNRWLNLIDDHLSSNSLSLISRPFSIVEFLKSLRFSKTFR